MGNLIIKKVLYSGDKYFFESPDLETGINLIVGDNGSGKSTFSYFIEFGLGGAVSYFKNDNKKQKYREILDDSNNYVELLIEIDEIEYKLKRFFDKNDIFVSSKEVVEKFPITRHKEHSPRVFSDWLLEKLEIPSFELNFGTINWRFNFQDLFRLLCYDQDTEPRKIFKAPNNENFISDSSVIRKSIFEALLGLSSVEYFRKLDEYRNAQKRRDDSKLQLNNFLNAYSDVDYSESELESEIVQLKTELEELRNERERYQKENTNAEKKIQHIEEVHEQYIRLNLEISDDTLKLKNLKTERFKVDKLYQGLIQELSEIRKIIFTHEKLNLFAMEICPFCMSKLEKKYGFCICGGEFKDDDYEKFVYSASEYKDILKYKEKSLESVKTALDSYNEEVNALSEKVTSNSIKINNIKISLKEIINSIEFSGNSQIIDSFNDKILETQNAISEKDKLLDLVKDKYSLTQAYDAAENDFKNRKKDFETMKDTFEKNNKFTIGEFNKIYNSLMIKSSCDCEQAEIDEEYMPFVDSGIYKNKSADVPIRLMYFFTSLSLGLKSKTVRHPRFLLIDTPETVGIDKNNLKLNLRLLLEALDLSKKNQADALGKFQVILTTGQEKYPKEFAKNIVLRFCKKDGIFILSKKKSQTNFVQ